jgi:hypothetical protein
VGQEFLTNDNEETPRKTYTELFYEQLSFYLAIGMSYTEYFEGDCLLPKYYREAYKIRQERDDYNAWLQGVYVYKALDCALYNNPPLMKRGREPRNYFEQPFLQQEKFKEEQSEEQLALKQEQENATMGVWMSNFVNMFKNVK